ncbi:NAD kinase-like isoform X1 [Anopheles aquasalis]|uniref:NAD kinase-like isoform X1 n=2 Tax=Anopheles aquasalis TaxID=42839 RepID=UPI00215A179D|nr:NAD kinase-like isoform X1 [Anopheles aquasalis]XP_050094942.1 NAD kinase-like isoform X1 [Anopheles aquasalis]XP_050094943.1 NAD kinase-like isoform X1 [Anopheles aquasalis]
MAYLSDVDLATLHKSRLEERVQYRLSSLWTRDTTEPSAAGDREYRNQPASSSSSTGPAVYRERATAMATPQRTSLTSSGRSARCDLVNNNHIVLATETASSMQERILEQSYGMQRSILAQGYDRERPCDRPGVATTAMAPSSKALLQQQQHHHHHHHNHHLLHHPATISFDGHVIRPRIRSSNSMSSSGTSSSSSSSSISSNSIGSSSTSSTGMMMSAATHGSIIGGSSSSSSSSGRTAGAKHVEWSDDDHLHDDGYFSSDTRRRRSGTWPRTRSLNAPSPFQQFGPCGRIMKNSAMVMQIQDPASQRLTWYKPPLAVLVIKKVRDSKVLQPFVELVEWLIHEKHMVVWVEAAILDDALLTGDKRFTKLQDKLITFKDGRDDLTDKIDFIICLGGDGTLLYASLLFQKSVPPVMAFHLGSLGFLTPFQFDNFQEQVTNVLEGHAALTLRSRLRCIIVRKDKTEQEISTFKSSQDPSNNILVLNEVVIDRGLSSYLSNIDLFLDGKHITSVQGDGLIVSTPTGSTAYSAAAGASMIHPSVPAILVTPICPHSLSFRPIVLPAGVELKIAISPDSRNSSWVSFDGRNRQELLHGDSLHVTTSIYPVPSICAQDQIADWFDSLAECLHWNVRKRQKCLDELSDLTGSGAEDGGSGSGGGSTGPIDSIVRGMEKLGN